MGAEISTVDALPRAEPPSEATLPIVARIRRVPKVDLEALLWPIERAASSRRGHTAGRWLITGAFLLVLAAFAAFNSRAEPDADLPAATSLHEVTSSVHGHCGLAAFQRLQIVTAPIAHPADPQGLLSRR